MRVVSFRIAAMLLASAVTALSQTPKAEPLKKVDQSTIQRLERDIPELLRKGNVPGLSIALIRDGKTYWAHGFGVKNAKT